MLRARTLTPLIASLCLPLLLAACSTKDTVSSPGEEIELTRLKTAAEPAATRRITQPGDSVHGSSDATAGEDASLPAPSKPAVVEPKPEELAAAALASLKGTATTPAPDAKAAAKAPPTPPASVIAKSESASPKPAAESAVKPAAPAASEKSAPAAATTTAKAEIAPQPAKPEKTISADKPVESAPATKAPEPVVAAPAPASSPAPEPRKWATAQPLDVKSMTVEPPAVSEAPIAKTPVPAARVPAGAVTLFPGVRVDRAARVVEFDATVAVDAHDAQAPNVYLELIACVPDTREHESLVVTKAKAAQIHAALLLIGLEPGTPGRIDFTGPKPTAVAPTGPAVRVALSWQDGGSTTTRAVEDLVKNARSGTNLPPQSWLFAGSRFAKRKDASGQPVEVYDAEGMGTLIGLATFGSETIAPKTVFSPDAALNEPVWIADGKTLPKVGTSVIVRLTPVDAVNTPASVPATSTAPAGGRKFNNVER